MVPPAGPAATDRRLRCDQCPFSERLFDARGLKAHIADKHNRHKRKREDQ